MDNNERLEYLAHLFIELYELDSTLAYFGPTGLPHVRATLNINFQWQSNIDLLDKHDKITLFSYLNDLLNNNNDIYNRSL